MYALLVMVFWSQSGRNTWPTMSLTWHISYIAVRTKKVGIAEQSSSRSVWPTRLAEHSSTNSLCPNSLRLPYSEHKACASEWPQQKDMILPGRIANQSKYELIKSWMAQQLAKGRRLAGRIHCATTTGIMCFVHSQLAGTKGTWQGHVAAVKASL